MPQRTLQTKKMILVRCLLYESLGIWTDWKHVMISVGRYIKTWTNQSQPMKYVRDMIKTIILPEVSSASSCESAYTWDYVDHGWWSGGGVRDLTWQTRTLPHSLFRLTLVRTGWLSWSNHKLNMSALPNWRTPSGQMTSVIIQRSQVGMTEWAATWDKMSE